MWRGFCCVSLFLVFAPEVWAQGAISLGAGYHWLRVDETNLPAGFSVDLNVEWSRKWSLVVGVDQARGDSTEFGFSRATRVTSFGGGARYTPFAGRRLRPFAQALVGIEDYRVRVDPFGTDAERQMFLQPEAGLTMAIGPRLGAFVQGGWRMARRELNADHGVRMTTGGFVVLRR
jgi:hypothetical protein